MLKDPVVYNQYLSALEILDIAHYESGPRKLSYEKCLMKAASIGSFQGTILSLLIDSYIRLKNNDEDFKRIFYMYAFDTEIIDALQEYKSNTMDYLLSDCKNELLLKVIIARKQFELFEGRIKKLNITPDCIGPDITEKIMIIDQLNRRLSVISYTKENARFENAGGCKRTNG